MESPIGTYSIRMLNSTSALIIWKPNSAHQFSPDYLLLKPNLNLNKAPDSCRYRCFGEAVVSVMSMTPDLCRSRKKSMVDDITSPFPRHHHYQTDYALGCSHLNCEDLKRWSLFEEICFAYGRRRSKRSWATLLHSETRGGGTPSYSNTAIKFMYQLPIRCSKLLCD